ncbi:BspA family leucine-rich repeat surface protein [Mycoplasma yeatsii]|uniref:BspA family leucine-rich repeat surface protein n=1 Tax=Mycoplasma yeatsii TaxID=51365 RepID=UPI0005B2393B|nr:BspA family leucine-rich repeat surface protein [Mycoplasma yeatsii]AJM71641.1 PARCEL domain-containing protein [Mycoplasma yeatsii GM274B]
MKLVKSLISKKLILAGAGVLVTASASTGIGVGINQSNIRKEERRNLINLIRNTNIGLINSSELNENKLIELIKKINPNLNLDFSKLEFDIQSDKIIVKPKPNDNTYKNEVKISFTLSKDLSTIITNRDLGPIHESDRTNQALIQLIKQKNPDLDTDKVELVVQENKVIVKPKTGDKTYEGQVEISFTLSKDLSTIITNRDLGPIHESDRTNQTLIQLIKQKNPDLDTDKVELVVQENKVIVKPKTGDKTYEGQAEIIFSLSQDLSDLITERNLGNINSSEKTGTKLAELIKQKNPNNEIDFDKLELDIYDDKVIVKPKTGDKTYKGQVEVTFWIIQDLHSFITETNLGIINSSELNVTSLIDLLKQKNPKAASIDFSRLAPFILTDGERNNFFIRPKPGDNSYIGEVKFSFTLSKKLTSLITTTNLGEIDDNQINNQKIIELINKNNPNSKLDFNKLVLQINGNKAVIKPKTGDKTYEGEVEFNFIIRTETQRNIIKIKHIWDSEFKDRFYDYVDDKRGVYLTNQKLLEAINRRLKANNLNISVSKVVDDEKDWDNIKIVPNKLFKIKYNNELIELDLGEFNKFNTKFKDDKKEEVVELGYIVSPLDGLFTAFVGNFGGEHEINIKKVQNKLSPKIESLFCLFSNNPNEKIDGIEDWDTSNVINMHRTFSHTNNFNQDITKWDTSNVTNMHGMFGGARSFNQDISTKNVTKSDGSVYKAWDISNVTDISRIFTQASEFNQDISNWDTSNVRSMELMFWWATNFNQDISNWNISNVRDMRGMFQWAENFNQDISNWDTSNVTDMNGMFWAAKKFNKSLRNWNTSNVTDMGGMFAFTDNFNQDISNWDTSNVTNMNRIFFGAENFNQDISTKNVTKSDGSVYKAWNTSNVTNMSEMFSKTKNFNQDISNWDTSNVTDMSWMFAESKSFNQNLSGWNVSKVEKNENFNKDAHLEFKDNKLPIFPKK